MEKKLSKTGKIRRTFHTIFKTVSYVYKKAPASALTRDTAFLIITILELYLIRVGGQFIDATADVLHSWESFDITQYFFTDSFYFLMIGLAIWIVVKGLNNLRVWLLDRISREVLLEGEKEVLDKVSTENMQEVERVDFQELLAFVPNYSIERLITSYDTFTTVVQQLIRTVSSMVILYEVIGWPSVTLVLISIAEPVVMYFGENKIRKFRKRQIGGIKFVNYLRYIALEIPNFPELRVNNVYKYIKQKYWDGNFSFNKELTELQKHFYIDNSFFAMIGRLLFVVFIIYTLFVSITKRLTIGDFKALYDYAESAYNGSFSVIRNLFRLLDDISYTDEFFALLEYEGFSDLESGNMKLSKRDTPTLKLYKVDFTYPGDKEKSLENISMVVNPGEKVAIVGGDGSGKSSLVKILSGLYALQTGEYFLGDYSVRELERGELKNQVAVVFQDFVRYNFTIERNIMLTGESVKVNRSRYEFAKEVAGVSKFMKSEGLKDDQLLGKYFSGGREIPAGYWQRIAIARMVYRDRNIMLMDEPFTYVDSVSRKNILDNIFKLVNSDDRILLYITRNVDNLEEFDRIYYLRHGKIVESGSYKELMKKKGAFFKEVEAS
ncbi:MAG: ABC transporter ATP-binding protein [Candidatus Dojkabacteria bacterium]|nr:MAG: ABC transporter ATP-binding protein [Candidatus Dojkabacteria bacterium]